tara:strand:+ start:66003 stop:66503 length:501 start_codon:yes stop_codon:yes gene_type:complete
MKHTIEEELKTQLQPLVREFVANILKDKKPMKTKLVPANLKTGAEAYSRMLQGEKFKSGNHTIYYNAEFGKFLGQGYDSKPPYSITHISDFDASRMQSHEPITWQDEVSEENPVLCWVSDDSDIEKTNAEWVFDVSTKIGTMYYESFSGSTFVYATPVSPSECYQD